MSVLVRFYARDAAGEILQDETVIAELGEVFAIEKGLVILGSEVTLRVEFDPPLTVPPASDG